MTTDSQQGSASPEEALQRLILDGDLERLEDLLAEFNLFDVLSIARQETQHSAFLAWLLDPRGSHGLRDYFLRGFLHRRPLRRARMAFWPNTEPDAKVYTDDARAYRGMPRQHEAVKHGVSEYVRGMAHTNGMESHWAALKRGYDGVYHQMSAKHLHRYVAEFEGRHNRRPLDTADQMSRMAKGADGKQLRYQDLVAA